MGFQKPDTGEACVQVTDRWLASGMSEAECQVYIRFIPCTSRDGILNSFPSDLFCVIQLKTRHEYFFFCVCVFVYFILDVRFFVSRNLVT